MPQKKQKQKSNSQAYLLFSSKQQLLFFTYDMNHPKRIDIEQFLVGKFQLFIRNKMYSSQLKSKQHLNPALNWNTEMFDLMINRMGQFIIQEQTIQFTQLKVKQRYINFFKVKMDEVFGVYTQNQLWSQFQKCNQFKSKNLTQLKKNVNVLQEQIENSLNKLEGLQEDQQLKINDLKGQLSALLNQKQTKLMELSGNRSKFAYKEGEQNQEGQTNIQSGISGWMSSQDDRMLVGSLFAPSIQYQI